MMPPVLEGSEESMYPHHQQQHESKSHRRSAISDFARRNKWLLTGAAVVLFIIIAVSVGVSGGGGGGSASEAAANPQSGGSSGYSATSGGASSGSVSGPQDPFTRKKADLMGRIKSSFTVLGLPAAHSTMLDSPESPQARALNWVSASEQYDNYSDDQRLQRYALACFFYATYAVRNAYVTQQVPWTTAEKWLSEEHECDWEGITCSEDRFVTHIKLEEHRISGTIPLDLVLLRESLESLMLTNNLIFMEGEALLVFAYLENLDTLMLADNYIVERNGLPESFRDLPNLKKLILSYNLLQGTIPNTYFENLHKLSHLEIESNYLSGPLPASLYDMDQLVYLYVRRNDLNFNFGHAIKSANWPNIFSAWFDHNNITGTLPTEVGKLTGLASFSLTNTTVGGTIPTEFGNLQGLRRLWLYGNKLTGSIPAELGNLPILEVVELYGNNLVGTMPQGTCNAVSQATYDYKVLSADCGKVRCSNCCTQCY